MNRETKASSINMTLSGLRKRSLWRVIKEGGRTEFQGYPPPDFAPQISTFSQGEVEQNLAIAGLIPAIHSSNCSAYGVSAQWIAGPSPAMTNRVSSCQRKLASPEKVPLLK